MKCALDYLNYEVVTYIDVINESPTLFPTITFFNLKRSKTNYSFTNSSAKKLLGTTLVSGTKSKIKIPG